MDRFLYLKESSIVGEATFGFDRYLNQILYRTDIWRKIRDEVIIRDNGCDLSFDGMAIRGRVIVHHMNPLTKEDILSMNDYVTNPEYLICVSTRTHQAIHFGDANLLASDPIVRRPNDTCPWRN